MQLTEFINKRQKPSIARWFEQHPNLRDEARSAILSGAPRGLVFEWLTDYHKFPCKITAFRNVADAWEKGDHAAAA